MELSLLPGYEEVLGPSPKTYEEYLSNTPTHLVLGALMLLNSELDIPHSDAKNQDLLFDLISKRFTATQTTQLARAYQNYKRAHPAYGNAIFAQRYLIAMMIKEFNRNLVIERDDTSPNDEFSIFMAYLLVVDEVNKEDEQINIALNKLPADELTRYRWAWTSNINQYEYTDMPHPGLGLYKLLSLTKYARLELRPYLKQYINQRGFENLTTFLGSFLQLVSTATREHPGAPLKRTNIVNPQSGTDTAHLEDMSINAHLGMRKMELVDLKRYPLYHIAGKGYVFLDRVLFLKKVYTGPFFELLYKTDLKTHYDPDPKKKFNPYSSAISLHVLEKICFQGILTRIHRKKHDVLAFDDGSDSIPDAYFRSNKTIFVIEFKGYIFPAHLTLNPTFEAIKKYIDERFISSDKKKKKGVSQLAEQIALLQDGRYEFDKKFNEQIMAGRYTIYPVICHTEYYSSMPGVSDYLGDAFSKLIIPKGKCVVKDLTIIDLTTFFQLALYGHDYGALQSLIDRYQRIMQARKKRYDKQPSTREYFNGMAGFDEIYRTIIMDDVVKPQNGSMEVVAALLDLKKEDLEEKL